MKSQRKTIKEQTSPILTHLQAAIQANEVKLLRHLLKEGVDINARGVFGMSALSFALHTKHYELARILIKSGADVNTIDDLGNTAMFHAIDKDTPTYIIQDLLLAGIEKDSIVSREDNSTPLILAIDFENDAVTNLFLKMHVNVNFVTASKRTPLNVAISRKSLQLVKLLIKHGANVNGQNKGDPTPLFGAIEIGDISIIRELTHSGAKIDFRISQNGVLVPPEIGGKAALNLAVMNRNLECVRYFLEVDVNKHKISVGDIKVAMMLMLTENDNSESKTKRNIHRKLIILLLSHVSDVNAFHRKYPGILKEVIKSQNWIALEELIYAGLKVNTHVEHNQSIFHFAIKRNLSNLVNLCLDFGADRYHLLEGKSPYQLALSRPDPLVIKSFLKHGHPFDDISPAIDIFNPPFTRSTTLIFISHYEFYNGFGHVEVMKEMLKNDAVARSCSKKITYPLHYLAVRGNPEAVGVLLEHGVPPSTLDSEGLTPLHLAAQAGDLQTCSVLLRYGACFNYRTSSGDTPETLAKQSNHKDVVKLFHALSKSFRMAKIGDAKVVECLKGIFLNGTSEFLCYINCVNRSGNSLMGEALKHGFIKIAQDIIIFRVGLKDDPVPDLRVEVSVKCWESRKPGKPPKHRRVFVPRLENL